MRANTDCDACDVSPHYRRHTRARTVHMQGCVTCVIPGAGRHVYGSFLKPT